MSRRMKLGDLNWQGRREKERKESGRSENKGVKRLSDGDDNKLELCGEEGGVILN